MRPGRDPSSRLSGLVIAGTRSGSGKTLATLGLAAALQGRGLRVQGFKCGPDFIDPMHLAAVSGRPVHNLDGWILSREVVLDLVNRSAGDTHFCLVEGVMGLFDGASGSQEDGSTAQMAKWLGLPVLLVVDARSQGRSAAALIQGFAGFDPDLCLAGVVFTQVGGPSHAAMLREAMATYLPDLPCLGFLPRRPDLVLPSRHLGLCMPSDMAHDPKGGAPRPVSEVNGGQRDEAGFWDNQRRAALAEWVEQGLDLDALLRISTRAGINRSGTYPETAKPSGPVHTRLAVARDQAFCFYYQENLRLLEQAGAEVVSISPLYDKTLPDGVSGLYLGGGYPELHAALLAANHSMRDAVRDAARAGMPIYAECGGMMYLLAELEALGGERFPMVGFFPGRSRMLSRFQALGYREVESLSPGIFGPARTVFRGHEFHYSRLEDLPENPPAAAFRITDRHGRHSMAGFQSANVLASYVHVHFGSHPPAAAAFVRACADWAVSRDACIGCRQ